MQWSTQVKSKDTVLKYYFGESEGRLYEKYSSKSLDVSDIKSTRVKLHINIQYIYVCSILLVNTQQFNF